MITANGKPKVPDGIVLANGANGDGRRRQGRGDRRLRHQAGRAVAPKGEANGYVITLGGKRIYFAGVTECVPEVRALKNIDVAFMPMNIPLQRMTPSAAAECAKAIAPKIVYIYHYDQQGAARLTNPRANCGAAGRRADHRAKRAGVQGRAEGNVDRSPGRPLVSLTGLGR